MTQEEIKDLKNTQNIRLYGDVFFISPFLVGVGVYYKELPILIRIGMITIGILTFTYNLNGYIKNNLKLKLETQQQNGK
ncbi:MAG: hypothetical protein AABY22_20980 [Nanoarchaeota archaeon]